MGQPRADHWAVKDLYKQYGLAAVREWHKIPLIDTTQNPHDEMGSSSDRLDGAFKHMLFRDAAYSTNSPEGDPIAYRLACDKGRFPLQIWAFCKTRKGKIWRLTWAIGDIEAPMENLFTSEIQEADPQTRAWYKEDVSLMMGVIISDMLYLAQCPEHPVEVVPENAKTPGRTTLRLKPWTREDLPTLIMLDPTKAGAHGRKDPTGTHASPRHDLTRGADIGGG